MEGWGLIDDNDDSMWSGEYLNTYYLQVYLWAKFLTIGQYCRYLSPHVGDMESKDVKHPRFLSL